MRGQAGKAFGWPRQVNVGGIKASLKRYGFDAIDIQVGVATRSASNSPSRKLEQSLEKNRSYRDDLLADGASVLEGYLVERKTTEEKQVDVLCAVAVCDLADRIATGLHRAKCIVVLSEDMDLMPAYEFARGRGVVAYAAAFDTVYQRQDQRDWIILTEGALSDLVSPVGRHVGSQLRRRIATIALSPDPPRSLSWTVHAPSGSDGDFLMRGNLGAPGLWSPGRNVRPGDKVSLFIEGVTVPEGGRFPHLLLTEIQPKQGPLPDVSEAVVAYWQSPTSIKVDMGTMGLASVRATPGAYLPNQRVAVLRRSAGKDQATYLVGALEPLPTVDGWRASESVANIEIRPGHVGQAWMRGIVIDTGDDVLVHRGHLDHADPGSQVAGFVAGRLSAHALPTVMPLSCCLPVT